MQNSSFIYLSGYILFLGILFATGSLLFTSALSKMPAGLASGLSASYVLAVLMLSRLFLTEPLSLMKVLGIILTIAGGGFYILNKSKL